MMDDPRFRFHAYCDAQSIPLVGVSGKQPNDPHFVLHCADSASAAQIQVVNDLCYKTPEVFGGWQPLPSADTANFQKLLVQDPTVPVSVKLALPGFLSLVQPLTGYFDKVALQSLWGEVKADSGTSGLLSGKTTDGELVSARIEKYAAQSGISLV